MMVGMERDSISEEALEARKRGMSYGQLVAAKYYPVSITQMMPDGAMMVRSAPLPPVVPGWEEIAERQRGRSVDGPLQEREKERGQGKVLRYCEVCGEQLRGGYRKYCSEECREEARKIRPAAPNVYVPIDLPDRPCKVCQKMMHRPARKQSYCSPECRKTGTRALSRQWMREHRPEKRERICIVCGEVIEGKGIKYCAACAKAERARRNRERWRQEMQNEGVTG